MTIEVKNTNVEDDKKLSQEATTKAEGESQSEETVELTPEEERASTRGWKPKDQWDGNPDDWRDARTFNDRGELLDKISNQSRELKQITAIVQQLSEQNRQVYRAGYDKALKDLKAQKAHAIKEGDGVAVAAIDDAIDNTKEALRKIDQAPASPQQPSETTAFSDFKRANSWYETSEEMREWAYGAGMSYANKHPNASEEAVYSYLEAQVKKVFPAKFQKTGPRIPASPDGESSRNTGNKGNNSGKASFEKVLANMPEDQARVARDMVRRGIVSAEKYVQDYNDIVSGR